MTVTLITVNLLGAELAERNLVRLSQENTVRDGRHILALAQGLGASGSRPLTLRFLAGPQGLPARYPLLTEGLNIAKINLYDLTGTSVWSTDPRSPGISQRAIPVKSAASGPFRFRSSAGPHHRRRWTSAPP